MPEQDFGLTVRGELTDDRLEALFEAGCDDATFSAKDGLTFAAFAREAPSLLDAILSAVQAVESVEGLEVLQVDPDELVWASEIAARTGRSRQSVDQLVKGQRGPAASRHQRLTPPATPYGAGPTSSAGLPPTKGAIRERTVPRSSAPSTGRCRHAKASGRPPNPRRSA